MEAEDIVRETGASLGFSLVGITAATQAPHRDALKEWLAAGHHGEMHYMASPYPRHDPKFLLPGTRSIIAVALNYFQPTIHEPGRPKVARYALGRDYHKVMRSKLKKMSQVLDESIPGHLFRACVDSAPIMERDFAHLAGLGWFGKNTMLINSVEGSWFFIGLLLTSLELKPDRPAIGGCGTCRACIEACPTGAIVHVGGRWQVDARRCISYLTIEHRAPFSEDQERLIGEWTVGCDVCQEVCPFNAQRSNQPARAQTTTVPEFLSQRPYPTLAELAQVSRVEWENLVAGSAVRRVGYERLKQIAQINLRNISNI